MRKLLLILTVAALLVVPVSASAARRCHKVTVYYDNGTHQTVLVCAN